MRIGESSSVWPVRRGSTHEVGNVVYTCFLSSILFLSSLCLILYLHPNVAIRDMALYRVIIIVFAKFKKHVPNILR